MNVLKNLFVLAALMLALTGSSRAVMAGPAYGTDGPAYRDPVIMAKAFGRMKQFGLTRYRFDANLAADTDPYEADLVRSMLVSAKPYGVSLAPIIQVPFQWGDRTDAGKYPKGDADALYQQGFNRTYAFVKQFGGSITDWELGNELNLRVVKNGSPLFGWGWTAAEFDTPLMSDWAQVLKGESDAIDKLNRENGWHLRKVLNTTSTMFGFLDYIAGKGVGFDVISYHYYETGATNPSAYWGGSRPTFNLFVKLASYGKPVQVNEVNCAEIYQPAFENERHKPVTEACYASLHKILSYLDGQKVANIEAVNIYELVDELTKGAPENRFGIMYDLNTAKLSAWIVALHAGATVNSDAAADLKRRGISK